MSITLIWFHDNCDSITNPQTWTDDMQLKCEKIDRDREIVIGGAGWKDFFLKYFRPFSSNKQEIRRKWMREWYKKNSEGCVARLF